MKDHDLLRKLSIAVILLIGLYCVASVWTDISFRYVNPIIVNGEERLPEADYSQLPAVQRWSFRVANLGLLSIGLIFAFKARDLKHLRTPLLIYAALWCWSIYLLIAKTAAPLEIIGTSALFSDFAPGLLGVLGLFFMTARDELWAAAKDNIAKVVVIMGVFIFIFAPFVEAGSRYSGRRYMGALTTTLQICAIVPIFIKPRGIPRFLNYVPLAAVFLCGTLTQTRLTFILTIMQLLCVAALKRRQIFAWVVQPRLSFRHTVALFFAASFVVAAILAVFAGPFRRSTEALTNRLGDDTRTSQASNFFEKVPASSLILGHGYPTGDAYTSQGTDGIDVGYVNAAYVGGVPASFCIFYFLAFSGILLLSSRSVDDALEVAPVCVTAGVAFLSSTVFDVSPGGVLFMILFGGRAYAVAHRRASRRLKAPAVPELRRVYAQ